MLSSTLSLPQLFHLTHLTESLTKIAKINFASCFKYMWLYHIGYLDVYVRVYVHMENITLMQNPPIYPTPTILHYKSIGENCALVLSS